MIAVIGCGNSNRQDDGAGPEVIRLLKIAGVEGPHVKLLDAGTDGMAVMFAARGCTRMIIVDAAGNGTEAGAIYEVPGAALERAHAPSLNLHDFRWEDALHAGRQIFRETFPQDIIVVLIGAEVLNFGIGLSPKVIVSVRKVAKRIGAMVAAPETAASA